MRHTSRNSEKEINLSKKSQQHNHIVKRKKMKIKVFEVEKE